MKKLCLSVYCMLIFFATKAQEPKKLIGKPMPPILAKTIDSVIVNDTYFKDKVVLLSFWFIGCPPCMVEIKYLNKLYRKYESNKQVVILSIAAHTAEDVMSFNSQDTLKNAKFMPLKRYFKTESILYPTIGACTKKLKRKDKGGIGVDCNTISKDYYVVGFPTMFFIDKKGIINEVKEGFLTESGTEADAIVEKWSNLIDTLLQQK